MKTKMTSKKTKKNGLKKIHPVKAAMPKPRDPASMIKSDAAFMAFATKKKAEQAEKLAADKLAVKKDTITVEYSSNNSGGSWWLNDSHWHALEKAGWKVAWRKDIKSTFASADENGRWLGALATEASFECKKPEEAISSWQECTNMDPWEEGCNCCGQPHNFSYTDEKGWHSARTEVSSSFDGWD
jgi:hypothetical protein